jgi:hypothetical protein
MVYLLYSVYKDEERNIFVDVFVIFINKQLFYCPADSIDSRDLIVGYERSAMFNLL